MANRVERLEALTGQRWQYRCVECLTAGVEQWTVCASCASERPPSRVDLFAELLERTAPDLLKLARAADAISVAAATSVGIEDWHVDDLRTALEPLFHGEAE